VYSFSYDRSRRPSEQNRASDGKQNRPVGSNSNRRQKPKTRVSGTSVRWLLNLLTDDDRRKTASRRDSLRIARATSTLKRENAAAPRQRTTASFSCSRSIPPSIDRRHPTHTGSTTKRLRSVRNSSLSSRMSSVRSLGVAPQLRQLLGEMREYYETGSWTIHWLCGERGFRLPS
jgi:hypothetical protein